MRFEEAGKAEEVLEKAKAANEDKIIINNCEVEVRVLEGMLNKKQRQLIKIK